MKYTWPYYLPAGEVSDFFQPARVSILQRLKDAKILESCARRLAKPSELIYVPSQFVDAKSRPFSLCNRSTEIYLSRKYPEWAIDSICSLGVGKLSPEAFLLDLGTYISTEAESFQKRPLTWHSQLAKALLPFTTDTKLKELLNNLRIIPLQNKKWTARNAQRIFFPTKFNSMNPPSSLNILLVQTAAATSPDCRKLFTALGVKEYDAFDICNMIIDIHNAPSFDPKSLTLSQLISHTAFLYKSSWPPRKNSELWFATTKDDRCQGSMLYIPEAAENDSPAARVFKQLIKKFPVIHDDYRKCFPTDSAWPRWIAETFNLSNVPHLVTSTQYARFQLSPEFRFMFISCTSSDVLQILVENWHHYSSWLDPNASIERSTQFSSSRQNLIKGLGQFKVKCRNGEFHLQDTVLPNIDPFVEENLSVPSLKLTEDPRSPRWMMLSYFGVEVKRDFAYYLRCLESQTGNGNPETDIISYMYQQIQAQYERNEEPIRLGKYSKLYMAPVTDNAQGSISRRKAHIHQIKGPEEGYSAWLDHLTGVQEANGGHRDGIPQEQRSLPPLINSWKQ